MSAGSSLALSTAAPERSRVEKATRGDGVHKAAAVGNEVAGVADHDRIPVEPHAELFHSGS
jgi:hypothetical protein